MSLGSEAVKVMQFGRRQSTIGGRRPIAHQYPVPRGGAVCAERHLVRVHRLCSHLATSLIVTHRPWLDEWQALLIARQTPTLGSSASPASSPGAPAAWYRPRRAWAKSWRWCGFSRSRMAFWWRWSLGRSCQSAVQPIGAPAAGFERAAAIRGAGLLEPDARRHAPVSLIGGLALAVGVVAPRSAPTMRLLLRRDRSRRIDRGAIRDRQDGHLHSTRALPYL